MAKSRTYLRQGQTAFLVATVLTGATLLWIMGPSPIGVSASKPGAEAAPMQDKRLNVRLRSFAGGMSGHLTVEPTVNGGRVRLVVMNLPLPQTLTPNARTFVVWAVGGGRVIRLGELKTDDRGNGGLEFNQPELLDRYSVIVTAETNGQAMGLMGALVLWTKAHEVAARYSLKESEHDEAGKLAKADIDQKIVKSATADTKPVERKKSKERKPLQQTGDFYADIDSVLSANGGGRKLELEGTSIAPGARGLARITARDLNAFVRARFRQVPDPAALGANTYVLWATLPDGRIVYMGSLPTDMNASDVYIRTGGFNSDDFSLFVTAERQRPVLKPSDQRALTPIEGKLASAK